MPHDVIGYYVFNATRNMWLREDEQRFSAGFEHAAEYNTFELADAMRQRKQETAPKGETLFVMGACGLT